MRSRVCKLKAEIIPIAGVDPRSATLHDYDAAVAIMFDFMNPVPPLRRLIDQGSKLRLDKPEAGGCAKHAACTSQKKPGRWVPGLLPLFEKER
jgi:hypothetical protein